jgi:uncharacterized protein YaiI (UPF0178 family)
MPAGDRTVWVDADACPVRAEVETVATRLKVPVRMVSNGGIRPSANPLVSMVYVAAGADEADRHIAAGVRPGDVVVTADVPLAARCVAAGAQVLRPDGSALTAANVGTVLAMRDLMANLRAADPFRPGGGRPFARSDRARFSQALDAALRRPPPAVS